eukprot:scaffold48850_cov32-Phaeocystis_antarctica.AAC.1
MFRWALFRVGRLGDRSLAVVALGSVMKIGSHRSGRCWAHDVRSLQCTKDDLLTPQWGRAVAPKFSRDPPPRQTGDGGLLRLERDGFSSFVRRKRSERRWAVDQAVGRAKQGRSTWPWSERWPVDASAAEKGGSRAR